MKIQKAFKFRLSLNKEQTLLASGFAGCRRYVYNKALEAQIKNRESGGAYIPYRKMALILPVWKKTEGTEWLSDCHSQVLQQALMDLEKSYINFFEGRADFPQFKKKGKSDSFRFPQIKPEALDEGNKRIKLPGLGWVKYRKSQAIVGSMRNITVSHKAGHWYMSVQVEYEAEQPIPAARTCVGVDVGIENFAMDSNGLPIAPINPLKNNLDRLRRLQKSLSRKQKFGCNWHKVKAKVGKLQNRIVNVRKDFLHKASTTISNNHAMVAVEDLKVSNMSASASGTIENPGVSVKAKSGLNRSIQDQGWSEFRRQLEYKLDWNGGLLVAVPPQNTSRRCPCCGFTAKDNRKTQAVFKCLACGHSENADVVGAKNILFKAHEMLAGGQEVKPAKPKLKRARKVRADCPSPCPEIGSNVCDRIEV
jgi:putative transposase